MKVAFITGITGQDGSYLAEILLEKGYVVHGLKRRSSSFNTSRIEHLYQDEHLERQQFFMHYGDLSDSLNLVRLISEIKPDEIYNLGAMSHVHVSFASPEYVANVDGLGTLRVLEAVRIAGIADRCRIYQASTSELFGMVQEVPQNEGTPFYPRSPYAVAKLYSYWICRNYREAYKMYVSNGILFNHESPRRGETFVTRKITRAVAKIGLGLQKTLFLGNLDSRRDWGHAKEYAYAQWLILQQAEPDDWVVATGVTTTVREFVLRAFQRLGIKIRFESCGIDEIGIVESIEPNDVELRVCVGDVVVRVDPKYFRPTEVDLLIGDSSKLEVASGWKPIIGLDTLITEMVSSDINELKKLSLLQDNGFKIPTMHNEFF